MNVYIYIYIYIYLYIYIHTYIYIHGDGFYEHAVHRNSPALIRNAQLLRRAPARESTAQVGPPHDEGIGGGASIEKDS